MAVTVEARLFLFIWTTCAGAGEIEMVCPIDGEYKLDPDNVRSARPERQDRPQKGPPGMQIDSRVHAKR